MTTIDLEKRKFKIEPGETWLTTKDYEEQYRTDTATQCRHRKDGSGPPFVVINGRILYPESGIIAWLNERLVTSTAELNRNPNKYAHLPAAREKARRVNEERAKS